MRRELYTPEQQASMAERDEAIVAMLEERPYTTGELGELFGLRSGMGQICTALARRSRIVRLPDNRWSLPHAQAPTSTVEHGPLERRHVDGAAILELLEQGPRGATEIAEQLGVGRHGVQDRLDDLLRIRLVKRLNETGVMVWALVSYQPIAPARVKASHGDRALRLPHDRPGSQTVKKQDGSSWWVTAPANGFSDLAAQHAGRMRESKEARTVPFRLLA